MLRNSLVWRFIVYCGTDGRRENGRKGRKAIKRKMEERLVGGKKVKGNDERIERRKKGEN